MTTKSTSTSQKQAFKTRSLQRKGDQPLQALTYLKHKSSFFVAALSLVAFIAGNMMWQHGWYAFWKAALGDYDDSLITYTGTVTPIALVPDFDRWSQYGGNLELHTFRQVPRDVLVTLPEYVQREQKQSYENSPRSDVYSVGNMGSYDTGAEDEGSHIGVDIRTPEGTPIRAVMNGIVTRVSVDPGGFGQLIVIRHPHAPDPENPRRETILYSNYAHLSQQLVSEGDIVQKGQTIAYSGKTGYATGPHLHFQIDREEAPWHPYWAFSYTEARDAGMNTAEAINAGLHSQRGYEYTTHPMLYVQKNYAPITIASNTQPSSDVIKKEMTPAERRAERIALRRAAFEKRQQRERATAKQVVTQPVVVQQTPSVPQQSTATTIVQVDTVATATPIASQASVNPVVSARIDHRGSFGPRAWQDVQITLLDEAGNIAHEDNLQSKLYMRTAFGEAEFIPSVLKASHFHDGVATVRMLPLGTTTVVIVVQPLNVMSKPMEFTGR